MKTTQVEKLKMYLVVRDYLMQFLVILNVLPNFNSWFTVFTRTIDQILDDGQLQGINKTGNATSKGQLRDLLVRLAGDTACKMVAYAKNINNPVLLKEVSISETKLKAMADTTLCSSAQGIHDCAHTHLADLNESYGINDATQEELQTVILNFQKSIGKPRISSGETSQATELLIEHFKICDDALDKIDSLVTILRFTETNIYSGYKKMRKIIKKGGNTLSIKGKVTDAVTGDALKGVTIKFYEEGDASLAKSANGKPSFVKKSSDKGGFWISNKPDGTYRCTAELPGYKKGEAMLSVVSGQMTLLNMGLEKI